MDNSRKAELYDAMLGYLVELISDEEELVNVLMRLGFTKSEIEYEGIVDCDTEEQDADAEEPIILDTQPIKLSDAEKKSWVCADNKAYIENIYIVCGRSDKEIYVQDGLGFPHFIDKINQTVYPVPIEVVRKLQSQQFER